MPSAFPPAHLVLSSPIVLQEFREMVCSKITGISSWVVGEAIISIELELLYLR